MLIFGWLWALPQDKNVDKNWLVPLFIPPNSNIITIITLIRNFHVAPNLIAQTFWQFLASHNLCRNWPKKRSSITQNHTSIQPSIPHRESSAPLLPSSSPAIGHHTATVQLSNAIYVTTIFSLFLPFFILNLWQKDIYGLPEIVSQCIQR